jgi:Uncharacterized protein conserved in bacteria
VADRIEELERKILELETASSFQEAAILDMNKAAMERDTRIARLEYTVRALAERVKEVAEGRPPLPANERPPHY